MNDVARLLQRLAELDVRVSLNVDRLAIDAPRGVLSAELRDELTRHREALIEHLRARAAVRAASDGSAGERQATALRRWLDAARVTSARQDGGGGHAVFPCSHMQRRLWFIRQMNPSSTAYNVPISVRMVGRIDERALGEAFGLQVARQDALRTRFVVVDDAPAVVIEDVASVGLEQVDLRDVPESERDGRIRLALSEFTARPFDLGKPPLVRAQLIRCEHDVHLLTLLFDHIVADGLSSGIFFEDLVRAYLAIGSGVPPALEPVEMRYVDHTIREWRDFAEGALDSSAAFWTRQLSGAPSLSTMPTDRPRPPVATSRGTRTWLQLDKALSDRIHALARSEGATLFMVLLSGLQILMHRHTGETDLPIGSAVGNRMRPEVDRVVGFFANNVVLRGDVSGDPSVRELIARTRLVATSAYAHQGMPFDLMVDLCVRERALDRSPLFQVLFTLLQVRSGSFELPGLQCEMVEYPTDTARFDLSVDVMDRNDGLRFQFEYNTDLYESATIAGWMRQLERLYASMVEDPDERISRLRMLPDSDLRTLLSDWNATDASYDREATVHGLFERQVAATPDAIALVFESRSWSYAELNARANRLARHLASRGARPGTRVGIRLERSDDMVVAVLAVLKAGAAYVPLDPSFPADRLEFMTQDAGLAAVVTASAVADATQGPGPVVVRVDADAAAIAACPDSNPEPRGAAGDLAYVIYTSGSTGRPKGVMLEHRSVVNFLESMRREPGIDRSDRWAAVTTLSFDIAGLELFGPLTTGATVLLVPRVTTLDGIALAALLERERATVLQATPATWRLLIESGWRGRRDLKMLCGGEALPRDLAERLMALGGALWNMYGPTETTIWSTVERVSDTTRPIAIGRPIANTQCHVLEPSGAPAAIGVPGELCIGGDGLARGYLGRDELTAERFATIELPGIGPRRLYRTGDVVRWRHDGRLEYVGRRDHQVKVRGFRIELGEIEAVLATHPGVAQGVVHVREDVPGDQRLVAYVVTTDGRDLDVDAVRGTLRAKLPEYMVPRQMVRLPELPLTPNGKIDRKALPAPEADADPAAPAADVVMTPVQRQVAGLWQSILGRERVGLHENFFDVGGHSLLLVRLQSAMSTTFGRTIPLVDLFQRTTVASQAEQFAQARQADPVLARARARAMRQLKR